MRYVIRDFATVHGHGFAVVHVDEANLSGHSSTCHVLRQYTADGEAYQLDNGSGLTGSEYEYRETSVEAAEAAHRRRFEGDFPMRRHDCVVLHLQRLARMVTVPELADELGLDATDMDDLWERFEDANPDHPLFTKHQRDGHWLLEPLVAYRIRRHVRRHPDEYRRRPAPTAPHYPQAVATSAAGIEGGIEGVIGTLGQTSSTLEQFRTYLTNLRARLEVAQWSGVPLERLEAAAAAISGVQDHVTTAADSIRTGGYAVRDTYTAHSQVGDKASVAYSDSRQR